MNTDRKGEIGETSVVLYLLEAGYNVVKPVVRLPYDIGVEINRNLKRIQVKYRALQDNGVIRLKIRNRRANGKRATIQYNDDNVDAIAVYCPDMPIISFININEIKTNELTLRLIPANNICSNGSIHYAQQYTNPKRLWDGSLEEYIIPSNMPTHTLPSPPNKHQLRCSHLDISHNLVH